MTVPSSSTEVPPTGEKNPKNNTFTDSCSVGVSPVHVWRHLSQMTLRISARRHLQTLNTCFPTHNLTKSHSGKQSHKTHTHTQAAKQLITIYTGFSNSAAGCRCALLSFQTRANNDSLIVAGETRVALLSHHLYEHAPIPARPVKGKTGWQMEMLNKHNIGELRCYSQTKRPRQAEVFSLLLGAKQHYKSWISEIEQH